MAYTTIDNPELYFQCKNFSGNAGTQALTFDNTDTSMQPDMVWLKKRNATAHHHIVDSVRGVGRYLFSNLSNAEGGDGFSDDGNDLLRSFDSNGFTIDAGEDANASGATGISWCWKESATAGFDIVSFTGNGSARTISHSLSAVPNMIIVKNRDEVENWCVNHTSIANTKALILNTTTAELTDSKFWNDTSATSSVFTVGNGTEVNGSSDNMIAYLFANKQGAVKCGSYTGNGNADGTFVFCGLRPAFILLKNTTTSSRDWMMYDNKRQGYNGANNYIVTNTNGADQTGIEIDILSNGFKARSSATGLNASGVTHVFMAFAEQPFVNSKGVPCNAR